MRWALISTDTKYSQRKYLKLFQMFLGRSLGVGFLPSFSTAPTDYIVSCGEFTPVHPALGQGRVARVGDVSVVWGESRGVT